MHTIGFWATLWGQQGQYMRLSEFLTQRNFVAEFHRKNVSFTRKTANWRF